MAKVMILSIPEEEESLIDKIMAVVNSTQNEQRTEMKKSVSVIHIGTFEKRPGLRCGNFWRQRMLPYRSSSPSWKKQPGDL